MYNQLHLLSLSLSQYTVTRTTQRGDKLIKLNHLLLAQKVWAKRIYSKTQYSCFHSVHGHLMLVHQCILWVHHRSRMHSRYYYYAVSKCKLTVVVAHSIGNINKLSYSMAQSSCDKLIILLASEEICGTEGS